MRRILLLLFGFLLMLLLVIWDGAVHTPKNTHDDLINIAKQIIPTKPPPSVLEWAGVLPRQALVSEEVLPEKVADAFRTGVVGIRTEFNIYPKFSSFRYEGAGLESYGTGFMIKPNIFVSARHIFFVSIGTMNELGLPFIIDNNGLPKSKPMPSLGFEGMKGDRYYDYNFQASSESDSGFKTFPLTLLGMGKPGTMQDFSYFKSDHSPGELKPIETEDNVMLGETIYATGRFPLSISVDESKTKREMALLDLVNFTFKGKVNEIITDMPINRSSKLKKIYRLICPIEQGFSGGPILNQDGKAVGIAVLGLNNLRYAISITDVKDLLRSKGIQIN